MNTRFDELLKSKGVSRYQVFKATGVPQSSLSDFLSGKSTPKYENMKKLADYFGVSVEYLLGNEQKEKPSGRTSEELDEELKFALFGGSPPKRTAPQAENGFMVRFLFVLHGTLRSAKEP